MKNKTAILALAISIAALGIFIFHGQSKTNLGAPKETTYERVLRTGTINCGYSVWAPLFFVDANGEKKGIFHDMTEEAAKRLGLKVVWQEEIGWGSVVEAVRSEQVDMACFGYWLNPGRIKNVSSSVPQLYSPLYVWVRQDDERKFASLDDLNSNQLTLATIDGSAENQAMTVRFPNANRLALPEMDTSSDEIESLTSHKADFVILDAASAATYIASNPGKIRSLFPNQPVVVFPTVALLPPEDFQFKEMIDDTFRNLEYDGTLDAILKTYHAENLFLRNAGPVKP